MPHPPDLSPSRRALLRGSIGTLGSLFVASKLSACSESPGIVAGAPPVPAPQPPPAAAAGAPAANAGGSNAPTPSAEPAARPATAAGAPRAPASRSAPPPASPTPAAASPAGTPSPTSRPQESAPPFDGRVACPVSTSFPAISDSGPRTAFTRMDRGDQFEFWTVGIAAALYAEQHADTVLHMLRLLDRSNAGYPLSILSHSLQAATRARRANASDELVLCALCHHLGTVIMPEGQAELSAAILRGFVSDDAYRIVRHQEEFQLLHYGAHVQLPTSQRERYADRSWYAQACVFCDDWDSPSYAADYDSLPLETFEPLVRDLLGTSSGYLVGTLTSEDCIGGRRS